MMSIPTTRPVMKLSRLHIGEEEKNDERDDDDERDAVVDADDAAVAAVVGHDPRDPCAVGHCESDRELHQPL